MKREFYLQDDQSNKFWTVEVVGNALVTTNGRIGAKPRETRHVHADAGQANAAAEKEILSKRRGGYIEGRLDQVPEYKLGLPPRFVRINLDDDCAEYVGKLADGRQFFLTFPFVPQTDQSEREEYIALYLFDEFGILSEAKIFSEKAEGITKRPARQKFVDDLLAGLGKTKFADIKVAPFAVEKFGRQFGLIFDAGEPLSEDGDEGEEDFGSWVTVEPGNYMAFSPPWDGEYDT